MKPTPRPESLLPLTSVVFEILVSLASEDRHGYSILSDVRERTGEPLLPGSLYRAMARLLEGGLVEELDERPDAALKGLNRLSVVAPRLERQLKNARAAQLLPRKRP